MAWFMVFIVIYLFIMRTNEAARNVRNYGNYPLPEDKPKPPPEKPLPVFPFKANPFHLPPLDYKTYLRECEEDLKKENLRGNKDVSTINS